MLRVFQAAIFVMGALLLMMTNMVGQARENQPPPYEMMLHQYQQNNLVDSWLLFNPYTGRSRPFLPEVMGVTFLGWAADDALIYSVIDGQNYALYRTHDPATMGQKLADRLALPDGIWSTDRRYLLVQQIGLRGDNLLSVRLDGSGSVVIKGGLNVGRQVAISTYAFSPDGLAVAMTVREAQFNAPPSLYIARLDGTAIQDVTPPDGTQVSVQAWLPVHEGLIIQADSKLFWLDPQTGATRRVTADKGYPAEFFVRWTSDPTSTGWIGISEATSGVTQLHLLRAADGVTTHDEGNIRTIIYSPDASRVMLMGDDGTWAILEIRTGQRRVLELPFGGVNTQHPVWSPNGRYLAVASHESGLLSRSVVWLLDATQSAKFEPLWTTPDGVFDPFWLPSSDRLVFASNAALTTGLVWMKPDGSQRQSLTHANDLGQHDFSAWGPPIDKDWSQRPYLWGIGFGLCVVAVVGQATRRFSRARHQLNPSSLRGHGLPSRAI